MPRKACEHDYNYSAFIEQNREIGEFIIITGLTVLNGICNSCGEERNEIATAGYIINTTNGESE